MVVGRLIKHSEFEDTKDVMKIVQILLAGGLLGFLGALLTVLFHYLSLHRQYRQALEQKMIERMSDLVESYYEQISHSSNCLRTTLEQTIQVIPKGGKVGVLGRIGFHYLLTYLHYVDQLAQNRPRPLFTETEAEESYVGQLLLIYESIPFDVCNISFLLKRCRLPEGLMPVHEFVKLVDEDADLKRFYEEFSGWLGTCRCSEGEDENCEVHRVIEASSEICQILEEQTLKMYRLWYDHPKKLPKAHAALTLNAK